MKKIILPAAALCMAASAFAGKGFRPIHFTSYWPETQKSGLDMQIGSSPVAGMSQRAAGDIIINTADSTFSIGAEGTTPEVYKLTEAGDVSDEPRRSCESVYLKIKDRNGAAYNVTVERHYDLRFVKVFVFPKGSDTYRVYGCDYLKKLK